MTSSLVESYPTIKKYLFLLGKLLSVAAILFILYTIFRSASDLKERLDFEHPWLLAVAVILFIGYFMFRSLGWHYLCRFANSEHPWLAHAWYLSSSEILRYIPGNVWGLGARVVKGARFGISRVQASHLLLEDAINCVGAAGLFCLALLPFAGLSQNHLISTRIVSLSVFGAFLIYTFFQHATSQFLRKFFPAISLQAISPLLRIKIFAIYLVQWLFFGCANVLVGQSIASHTEIVTLLLIGVFSWLIGYISLITPMGLGVREGVFTTLLAEKSIFAVAGFIAIASRIVLIIAELAFYIFTMIGFRSYEKKHSHSNWVERGS